MKYEPIMHGSWYASEYLLNNLGLLTMTLSAPIQKGEAARRRSPEPGTVKHIPGSIAKGISDMVSTN